jgi:hypothetical protein
MTYQAFLSVFTVTKTLAVATMLRVQNAGGNE